MNKNSRRGKGGGPEDDGVRNYQEEVGYGFCRSLSWKQNQ